LVTALLVARRPELNDWLVEITARFAQASGNAVLVIGRPRERFWVECLAPLTGRVCAEQIRADAQVHSAREVRRCVRLLPDTIAAQHVGCSAWTSSALGALLRRSGCGAIVASDDDLFVLSRRIVRAAAARAGAELVFVRSPGRASPEADLGGEEPRWMTPHASGV
jgi:hypothetical protein